LQYKCNRYSDKKERKNKRKKTLMGKKNFEPIYLESLRAGIVTPLVCHARKAPNSRSTPFMTRMIACQMLMYFDEQVS